MINKNQKKFINNINKIKINLNNIGLKMINYRKNNQKKIQEKIQDKERILKEKIKKKIKEKIKKEIKEEIKKEMIEKIKEKMIKETPNIMILKQIKNINQEIKIKKNMIEEKDLEVEIETIAIEENKDDTVIIQKNMI